MSAAAVSVPGMGGDTGGPIQSGGDISGDLGSVLGSGFDEAFGSNDAPAGDTPPEQSAPAEVAAPEADTEIADPAADLAPETDQTLDAAPATPGDYPLSPDGKSYLIPKTDFQSIKGVQQYHTQVSQLFPTPQEAQNAATQASDFRQMSNDWMTGAEPNIDAVMNYFAGGDHIQGSPIQQKFQQSFMKMAERMPETLSRMNPQAHEAFVNAQVGKAIEMAYEKASTTGNPEDLKRAQELDWGVTGQYKTELPKIDPQVKAQQDFERRQAEFSQQRTQMLDSQLKAYNTEQVEGAKFNEVNGMIDKTLSKIADRYTPIAYKDLKTGIQRELIDAMSGRATDTYPNGIPGQREWYAEHKQAFDQLVADFKQSWNPTTPGRGLEQRVTAYRQDYLNRANRILPSIAKPRIETATRTPGAARSATGQFAGKKPAVAPVQSQPAPQNPNKRLSSDEWQAELRRSLTV